MIPIADLALPSGEISYVKDGHLATVTLNRPDRGNALTPEMHSYLHAIWLDVEADPTIRCAIVTGAGVRHFCTGADVVAVAETGNVGSSDGPLSEELRLSSRQNGVGKPVVAAVNGIANGAGLHFVVDADVVVASHDATFMDSHVNVGMVGAVENIGLAKRMPIGQALRMTLEGKSYRLAARRAYELGMVDELVAPSDLMPAARNIAHAIAQNSPEAVRRSKEAIWASLELPYAEALEHGWRLAREHWSHPDFTEGARAFAERRTPEWTA